MKKIKKNLLLTPLFLFLSAGTVSLSAQCNGSFDCLGTMDTGFNSAENSRYLVDYTFTSPYKILGVDCPFPNETRIDDCTVNFKLLRSVIAKT